MIAALLLSGWVFSGWFALSGCEKLRFKGRRDMSQRWERACVGAGIEC